MTKLEVSSWKLSSFFGAEMVFLSLFAITDTEVQYW